MRFLSVCSGIEAASVAWEPLGWKAVGFSEIEPFPCAVLAHRFPKTPNYGSLTEYASWPIAPGSIDLLVGGTPCQSFSVAGLRKGMADPRGNLALVFLGLADRVKPRWIVWENVPGVLSSNGGRDFGSFLGALEQLGYGWAYRVLDAQHFGVPQRRRRVFVVACLGAGGWESAAKVLFEPESLSGDTAKGRKKGQGVASDAQGGAGANLPGLSATVTSKWSKGADAGMACDGSSSNIIPEYWNGQSVTNTLTRKGIDQLMPDKDNFQGVVVPQVAGTLDTECGGGKLSHQSAISGHLIPCSSIQSSITDSSKQGDTRTGQDAGVPFRKSKRAQSTTDDESWVEAAEANTLNNFDLGDTRTTHAVVSPTITTCKGSRGGSSSEAIDEITAIHLAQASVVPPVAIQGTIIGRGENAGPQGTGATEGGPMFTLTKTDIHGVAHAMPGNVAPTVTSSGPPYSRTGNERVEADALAITTTTLKATANDQMPHVAHPIAQAEVAGPLDAHYYKGPGSRQGGEREYVAHPPNMAVRRLTPVECMRLQGFPDDWARIPWKGKPADQCPDGPQYKAAGNSMAVPVMRWIGSRIAAVEQLSTQPTK